MKVEHEYCDVCGKQMTEVDSDGQVISYGLWVEKPGDVDIRIKRLSGYSSSKVFSNKQSFCSIACYEDTQLVLLAELKSRTK